jgi:hypothetical protein
MRTRFDQLAKGILEQALSAAGEVRTQEEIPGEVQSADVWFEPAPGNAAARAQLGLLGRIAATSCLIEPFHTTPGAGPVLDCVSKQLTLRRNLVREARRNSGDAPLIPRLWLLSVGRPRSVLTGLRFEQLSGWPPGIWQGPPLLRTYVVVLRDLPATRETLALRLLGAGQSFWRAVEELRDLPADAWEPHAFLPLLLAYRVRISQDPEEASEIDMSYAKKLRDIYDDWERRVQEQSEARGEEKGRTEGMKEGMKEGRTEGEQAGIRESIEACYRARFGDFPADLRAAVDAMNDVVTLRRWVALCATVPAEDIAAAILPAGQPR